MFLVKNSNDPTNWIFEASGLHIPSKARDRNERKYYQISTTFLNTYGSHRGKQGQCTQLPIISKVKKYHNKNTKKILRKKIKKNKKKTRNSLPGLHEPIQSCLPRCRQRK